jgi:hypothetical protein
MNTTHKHQTHINTKHGSSHQPLQISNLSIGTASKRNHMLTHLAGASLVKYPISVFMFAQNHDLLVLEFDQCPTMKNCQIVAGEANTSSIVIGAIPDLQV